MTHGQLTALMVGDRIERWHAIGFAEEPTITIGSTLISSVEDGSGICTAAVDQVDSLDGLALRPQAAVADAMASPAPSRHGNGVVAIDHIVVMTPDSGRTTSNFEAAGFETRRVRNISTPAGERRQTFFWLGDVICEVVGPAMPIGDGPATWWGLALTVEDLDAAALTLGANLGGIKPAVQPGRRVATLSRSARLTVPIMFISPRPAAGEKS